MSSDATSMIWLAADYHFPATYSCRFLMSSIGSVQILPTPGSATVRLALIRTGVELFGIEYTRDDLFPVIRSVEIAIRPPKVIAVSAQSLRTYKASKDNRLANAHLEESITYREFAHTAGLITVYLQVPSRHCDAFRSVLKAIGYWGQASSFAQCTRVNRIAPAMSECAVSLRSFGSRASIRHLVTGLVTEFRDGTVTWEEVVAEKGQEGTSAVRHELYVWPMRLIERRGGDRVLLRCSIQESN